jgi:glycosyltransferase involved in cell wall biosynthesis
MRICILSDHIPPVVEGGAAFYAWNMALQWNRRGHEVIVITTTPEGPLTMTKREGITVHSLPAAYIPRWQAYLSLWNPGVVREIKSLLAEFKPEVVHAHNIHGLLSYRALVIAKKMGARVFITCHDVMSFNYGKLTGYTTYKVSAWRHVRENRFRYNPLRNVIIRRILSHSVDTVVAVSDALKEALVQNGIENVVRIHNGINVKEWEVPESAAVWKKTHGIGESAILYAGRLSIIKGGLQLIEVLPAIVARIPSAQLLVAGIKNESTEEMLTRAKELGVAESIVFTGLLREKELRAAFHSAALVVVPSLCFDSFPTVNLEAMACAKPVVASTFGGSDEAVLEEETGYVVDPYDRAALTERILLLLKDPEKSRRMGERGRARVEEYFTLEKNSDAYQALYNKIAD